MAADVIKAQRFELVDDAGRVVGGFGPNRDDGHLELWLTDGGNVSALLYAGEDGHGDLLLLRGIGAQGFGSLLDTIVALQRRVGELEQRLERHDGNVRDVRSKLRIAAAAFTADAVEDQA